jgi:hypothetical protein
VPLFVPGITLDIHKPLLRVEVTCSVPIPVPVHIPRAYVYTCMSRLADLDFIFVPNVI